MRGRRCFVEKRSPQCMRMSSSTASYMAVALSSVLASRANTKPPSEAAGIPIVPTPPVAPSLRPYKRRRSTAAAPKPPAVDDIVPAQMPSQAEYYCLPPHGSPRPANVYGMPPSFAQPPVHPPYPTSSSAYPGHSTVLYLMGNGAWPAAEQNNPPAHHSFASSASVSPYISPNTALDFWPEPAISDPYEDTNTFLLFDDDLHDADTFPQQQQQQQPAEPVLHTDWRMIPHTFILLYQSLDASVPGIDGILERNRVRLEGGQPSAPRTDTWAGYPAAGEYACVPRGTEMSNGAGVDVGGERGNGRGFFF